MPDERLQAAVDVLLSQIEDQELEIIETKKTVNALRRKMGLEPLFVDLNGDRNGSTALRPDQFYGKPLATAVTEYLDRRRQACGAEEILKGLEMGGFDFRPLGWKEGDRLRVFTMTLAKNSSTFHRLPNGTFGLLSWYDEALLKRTDKKRSPGEKTEAKDETPTEETTKTEE